MIHHYNYSLSSGFSQQRRKFIVNILKAAGASTLLVIPGTGMAAGSILSGAEKKQPAIPETNTTLPNGAYTVQDIISLILKDIPNAPFAKTVDTLKSGDKDQVVTGIVTTMFATIPIIRQAIKYKANFIIAHEPTFYNHRDDLDWVTENETQRQKQQLLKEHNIAVWRFHDYWHAHVPDGITYGVVKKAGWEKYYKGEDLLSIPAAPLKDIVQRLKNRLNIKHVRVIGDLSQQCRQVLLMPGASGGQAQVSMAIKYKPDVVIVGEVSEWETAEYIRDSVALGVKISLIILGHAVSEEPGMEWLKEWLQPKLKEMKIIHIPTPDPFTWM